PAARHGADAHGGRDLGRRGGCGRLRQPVLPSRRARGEGARGRRARGRGAERPDPDQQAQRPPRLRRVGRARRHPRRHRAAGARRTHADRGDLPRGPPGAHQTRPHALSRAGAIALALSTGAAALVSCSGAHGPKPGAPRALTVDGMAAPIGLATDDVAFAWESGDVRRDAAQHAYRIVVWKGAAPVWDSGKVVSPEQAFVPYGGPALAPDTAYRWTVQTWAANGGPSPLAPPATFETGLRDQDWRASWVQRPPDDSLERQYVQYTYARKEVRLGASPIVRARAYVSADQQYELNINGQRAGKGQAYSFPDEQYYETLDVTRLLRAGAANAFALVYTWQGETKGHPAGRAGAILQVSVDHADGTHEDVVTDGTWEVRKGAWLPGPQRDLEGDQVDYVENIDGRAIPLGWDEPGFD